MVGAGGLSGSGGFFRTTLEVSRKLHRSPLGGVPFEAEGESVSRTEGFLFKFLFMLKKRYF